VPIHDEAAIREAWANCVATFTAECVADRPNQSLNFMRSLFQLLQRHDEPVLRENWAKSVLNYSIKRGGAGPEIARALIRELSTLALEYDEPILREILAMSLTNLSTRCLENQVKDTSDIVLGFATSVLFQYDERVLRERWAEAAFNLVLRFGWESSGSSTSYSLVRKFSELVELYHDREPHLRDLWSACVASFIIGSLAILKRTSDLERLDKWGNYLLDFIHLRITGQTAEVKILEAALEKMRAEHQATRDDAFSETVLALGKVCAVAPVDAVRTLTSDLVSFVARSGRPIEHCTAANNIP
jgi:hypothetical protein